VEPHTLWNVLLTTAIGAGGWVLKSIYSAIKSLETDLAGHKVEVAKTYAQNADLSRLEDKIDRVLDKLDRKADK